MAIDRLDILIRQARARAGNQEFGDGQGVPQRNYVDYANNAQQRLYNLMMLRNPNLFTKQGYVSTTANVAEYDLPTDVYLKSRLLSVQYTPNGNAQLYYPLAHRSPRQQVSISALPDAYFLRNGQIILSPMPMTGYANAIRLNYQYVIPTLDMRRARIASVNTGTGTYTLVDDALLTQETESDLSNEWVDTVSVVDSTGLVKDAAKTFVSYNSTTKALVCTSLVGSLAVAGDFLVFGSNVTTHSVLPDICGRYIVEYMALRSQVSDTSTEAQSTNAILTSMEQEILESIDMLEDDPVAIAILDNSMLSSGED